MQGYAKTAGGIALALPMLAACGLHIVTRQAAKEAILKNVINGLPENLLRQKGVLFAEGPLNERIKPEGLKKLRWHQSEGHRCILISASLDVYLKPWAEKMGFNDFITSSLQVDSKGHVSGLLKGLNCWGPEKKRRLLELVGPKDSFELYAYGDSRGDRELLDLADHPFYRTFISF